MSVQGEFLESGSEVRVPDTYKVWKVVRVLTASQGAFGASYIHSFGGLAAGFVCQAGTFGSLTFGAWQNLLSLAWSLGADR